MKEDVGIAGEGEGDVPDVAHDGGAVFREEIPEGGRLHRLGHFHPRLDHRHLIDTGLNRGLPLLLSRFLVPLFLGHDQVVEGLAFVHTFDSQELVQESHSLLQQLVVFLGSPIASHRRGTSVEFQGAGGVEVAILIFDLDVTHHNGNRDRLVRFCFSAIPITRFRCVQSRSNGLEDFGNRVVVFDPHDGRRYVTLPPRSTSLVLPLEEF